MHIYLDKSMISAFVKGEFCSKKSTIPSGIAEGWYVLIFSNFKFCKWGKSTFHKPGTKQRVYAMREGESW